MESHMQLFSLKSGYVVLKLYSEKTTVQTFIVWMFYMNFAT